MMKFILLIPLLYFLFACQPTYPALPDASRIEVGTKALDLRFERDIPPQNVLEDTQFNAIVNVKNIGTAEINNGVYVFGFENQYLEFKNNKGALRVEGKSTYNPGGGSAKIQFQGKTKTLGPQLEGLTTSLSFTACFPYKTKAGFTICIDTSPGTSNQKSCTVIPQTFASGQGAPVSIIKIEPTMNPVSEGVMPAIKITVKNTGDGQLINSEYSGQYCLGRTIPKSEYNVVEARVYLLEDELECTKTQLKLSEQGDTIICTSPIVYTKREGTFPAPLTIELDYGYVQTITKDLRIESNN